LSDITPAAHVVAEFDETSLGEIDALDETVPPSSLWKEAGRKLIRRPMFIVAVVLIVLILAVALFPQLFTSGDPNSDCFLENVLGAPQAGHPLGFERQGCDIYVRIIHGAQPSVLVGLLAMLAVLVLGGVFGAIAGWYGKWADAILSRVGDIFYAIPTILAALVFLNSQRGKAGVLSVVLIIAAFAWPQMARITRGAVLAVKHSDFVTASRALGVSRPMILVRHVLPNAAAPMIVMATTSIGTYVVMEATLSFLGLGLPITTRSWGWQISDARSLLRTNPEVLFWPSAALLVTVLAFIMLGDAVRDALDPKAQR